MTVRQETMDRFNQVKQDIKVMKVSEALKKNGLNPSTYYSLARKKKKTVYNKPGLKTEAFHDLVSTKVETTTQNASVGQNTKVIVSELFKVLGSSVKKVSVTHVEFGLN